MDALPELPDFLPATALTERLLTRARALVQDGRAAEALPMLDRLGAVPACRLPTDRLRAEAMLQLGRLEDAEAAADAAIAQEETAPALRRLRARIRLARGAWRGAIDDAAAAVMAMPGDMPARLLLGTALLEERRFDEAIWFLGEAFRADPTDPALQARLGQAFMLAGRHEPAAELLAHCEAGAPDFPGIAALRAQAMLLAGDAEGAIRLARAALDRGKVESALHGVLAHALVTAGRLAEAGPHFAAAARLAPGSAPVAAASGSDADPATGGAADPVTEGYVATLFDGYAPHFEVALLGLGYRIPGLIRRAVERLLPAAPLGAVLDLGCGTGLVGAALSDLLDGTRVAPLVGIDLSRRMLEQAAAKGIYTTLRHAELTDALRADGTAYALITAADVFNYLGRLDDVLTLCRERLAPGGMLLFSVERAAPGQGWRLGPEGRFAHAPDYVAECLAAAGLEAVECREEAIRLDDTAPIPGLLVAARAAVR